MPLIALNGKNSKANELRLCLSTKINLGSSMSRSKLRSQVSSAASSWAAKTSTCSKIKASNSKMQTI